MTKVEKAKKITATKPAPNVVERATVLISSLVIAEYPKFRDRRTPYSFRCEFQATFVRIW